MPRNICVVITARPSYSRIKTALVAMREHSGIRLQLVVAASALLDRYGAIVRQIKQDGFELASSVFNVLEGENLVTMAKTTGLGLMELATVFDNLRPDMVVSVADRYETIATAIAASYMNIPVVHIQGGEVTGSIDEKVRHAVTKLSNLHCVSTELAAERVRRMGESPDSVHVTGCPSIDQAFEVAENPAIDFDLLTRYGGVGAPIDTRSDYIVVMQHPVTTEYDRAREDATETLMAVRELGMPTAWFWPNPDAGSDGTSNAIRSFRELHSPRGFHFFKNIAPLDFLRLIYSCRVLVGNSSVGIRESSFLGVPVVNIGSRQLGRERGPNVVDVDHDRGEILRAMRGHIDHGRYPSVSLYGDGKAGQRIADLLATVEVGVEKRLTY
jgi:UDP-hydrolysing UDP-N-acetyl-D-glucosamine 2-epimerase